LLCPWAILSGNRTSGC